MKKIISVVLALTMIMMLGVFAFAAPITDETPADQTVTVSTTTEGATETTNWTVAIPADATFVWRGTETKDLSYTVNCQLNSGEVLKVSFTSANDFVMKNGENGIAYTYTGVTTEQTFAAWTEDEVVAGSAKVPAANWDGIPVANYSDTLTYHAEVATAA